MHLLKTRRKTPAGILEQLRKELEAAGVEFEKPRPFCASENTENPVIDSFIDLEESELYVELQDGIKAAEARASQLETQTDLSQERNNGIEKEIELLRKQYASKKTAVLEAATIKLRAIALGR